MGCELAGEEDVVSEKMQAEQVLASSVEPGFEGAETLRYASADGESTIRALLWRAEGGDAPRGIVQIVHGMSEHVERYAPFAKFLVGHGFVVCANDHVGHGKSAACPNDLGHLPAKGGADVLVADVHALRTMVASRYSAGVPYVIFGHSMGSFVARKYITCHAEGLAAAILCGTGQQPPALSSAGNALAKVLAKAKGERYKSELLHALADGAYSKAVPDARTDFDWLSCDPSQVDAYIADPECGQMFTAGGYATLTALTGEVARAKSAAKVPKGLPLLFIAGGQDPVGDCGRGVQKAVAEYRAAGVETVDMRLYPGMRHEILNEPGRDQVMGDVVAWLAKQGI